MTSTETELTIPPLSRGGSLAEQVRDSLLLAINSGVLAPGTRLREIPLSEHFGLSKTPVREGLRLLEAEGVVKVLPRRGAVVMALDLDEMRHLYDFRVILEVASARAAATSGADAERLSEIHREMAGFLENQEEFHRLDVLLHCEISSMAGNPELTDAIARVLQRIQAVRVRAAVTARLKAAHRQHGQLIAAIRKGDADAAAERMTQHLESARDHVVSVLSLSA